VVLTRIDETAARMRAASQSLDDLQSGVKQELSQKIDAINSLAKTLPPSTSKLHAPMATVRLPTTCSTAATNLCATSTNLFKPPRFQPMTAPWASTSAAARNWCWDQRASKVAW
jgi:hypothetical protein